MSDYAERDKWTDRVFLRSSEPDALDREAARFTCESCGVCSTTRVQPRYAVRFTIDNQGRYAGRHCQSCWEQQS